MGSPPHASPFLTVAALVTTRAVSPLIAVWFHGGFTGTGFTGTGHLKNGFTGTGHLKKVLANTVHLSIIMHAHEKEDGRVEP
jgi:hypothetical protein